MTQPPIGVRTERHSDVLVLVLDNPPVNAGTTPVRRGLLDAVLQVEKDSSLTAAVIWGDHDTFVAGSDLREFGGVLPEPILPRVLDAIETCSKPIVAAIDGHALGGGFELSLACDLRVATARARLGSPEVSLGMTTGAGASQRLPRLIGRAAALEMITTCRRITGSEAHARGVVDALTTPDALLEFAVAAARTAPKRVLTTEPLPADDAAFEKAASTLAGQTPAPRPHVLECIELVRQAGRRPVAELMAQERVCFDRSRLGPEAAALRHLFFAARSTSSDTRALVATALRDVPAARSSASAVDPCQEEVCQDAVVALLRSAVDLGAVHGPGVAGPVDLAAVEDLAFPRHKGGPLWWTAHLSATESSALKARLALTAKEHTVLEALITEVRRNE